jgi:hypothetical protein
MAAPLNICTTIEQRGGMHSLWAKNMDTSKDIHKEMLPIWAAFFVDILFFHILCPQKRTTPRYSIVVHVLRGAAFCYVCIFMRIPIVVRQNKSR